jgi:hypothetical protein
MTTAQKPNVVRALTAAILAVLLAVPILAAPRPASADGPAPEYSFNNGFLRFGKVDGLSNPGIDGPTATRESVNAGGLLDTPYYFSPTADRWFQLTFSERALDLAVGAGRCVGDLIAPPTSSIDFDDLEAGKCFWHRNTAMASSNGDDVFPYYNAGTSSSGGPGTRGGLQSFTRSSTVTNGTGTITTQGSFTIVPPTGEAFPDQQQYAFTLRHVYELNANATFIKITTTLTNTTTLDGAPAAAPNVNLWVGTRDDYIGSTDQPTKVRGNIAGSGFVPLNAADEPSNAIKVFSGAEGILFYSTTPGVNTVFADCCGFYDEVLPVPPAFSGNTESGCRPDDVLDAISCNDLGFDGSYAIVLPIGDMVAGGSKTIVWYYAAGPVDSLGRVAEELAADSGGGTPPPPAPAGPAPSPVVDPGGGLPVVGPGGSSGSVGGVPQTPVPSVPTSGAAQFTLGPVQATFDLSGAGGVSGPAGSPTLSATRDRVATLTGGGMQAGTIAEVWLPLPGGGSRQVALLPIGPDGRFDGALPFTGELDGQGPLPIGDRTLQLFGVNADGQLTVINVGIRILQPGPNAPEPDRGQGAPPALAPGQSLATNAGLPTPVTITPIPGTKTLLVEGDGWLLDIAVPDGTLRDEAGNPIMEIVLGDRTIVAGNGFLPGTRAYVWLMSDPRFLGEVTINPDGTFRGSLPVTGVTPGPHTLQVSGVGTDGYIRAANLGVIVTGTGTGARIPTRVNTGGGPVPTLPLPLGVTIALAGVLLTLLQQQRTLAWITGTTQQQRTRARTAPGRTLPAFDALQARLRDIHRTQREADPPHHTREAPDPTRTGASHVPQRHRDDCARIECLAAHALATIQFAVGGHANPGNPRVSWSIRSVAATGENTDAIVPLHSCTTAGSILRGPCVRHRDPHASGGAPTDSGAGLALHRRRAEGRHHVRPGRNGRRWLPDHVRHERTPLPVTPVDVPGQVQHRTEGAGRVQPHGATHRARGHVQQRERHPDHRLRLQRRHRSRRLPTRRLQLLRQGIRERVLERRLLVRGRVLVRQG